MSFLAALALFATLTLVGAGPTLALLGRRFGPLWLLAAPTVGFALLVVGAEVPSRFLGGRVYGPWLLLALVALSLGLLLRARTTLGVRPLGLLVALPVLYVGVLPILEEGVLTTLSHDNHDYFYYLSLEHQLLDAGHGAPRHPEGPLLERMSDLLRGGGWRIGVSVASVVLAGAFGLDPHQIDGLLWACLYAALAPAALAAHGLIVPRASGASRAFVALSAALSGTALSLVRETFASHLASLPLFLLFFAVTWRALGDRRPALGALGALLLAATLSVLADGAPFLLLLGLVAVGERWWSLPHARQRVLRRSGWALVAFAAMPFTLLRIVDSVKSLQYTGYQGPRTPVTMASPVELAPAMIGLGARTMRDLREEGVVVGALGVLVVGLTFLAMASLARLRGQAPRLWRVFLAASALLLLGLHVMENGYPRFKLALTMHIFAPLLLATLFDRVAGPTARPSTRRGARWNIAHLVDIARGPAWGRAALALGVAILGLQAATSLAEALAPTGRRIGIRREDLALAARLADDPRPLHLIGTAATPEGLDHEHALSYLFARQGRGLATVPHPYSYLRIEQPPVGGWRGPFEVGAAGATVIVFERLEDRPRGRLRFRSGPFQVFTVEDRPLHRSFVFGFDAEEREPGRVFRWAHARGELVHELPELGGCLRFELRALDPTERSVLAVAPLRPDGNEGPTDAFPLSTRWLPGILRATPEDPYLVRARLMFLGTPVQPSHESRLLHYAIANLRALPSRECNDPP